MVNGEEYLNFKELRDARGLTLDDVFRATKITVANLEALESQNYRALPPPVYTIAYIRAYAKLLEIDARQFINSYEKYLAELVKNDEEAADENVSDARPYSKKIIIIASFLILFGVLVFLIFSQSNFRAADILSDCPFIQKNAVGTASKLKEEAPAVSSQPNLPPASQVLNVAKNIDTKTSGYSSQLTTPVNPAKNREINDRIAGNSEKKPLSTQDHLIIVAHEETWLRITEDDGKSSQVLLKPGERLERNAPKFFIDVGNAGGISLEFQGNKKEKLGKSGEVVHLRLP